MEFCATTGCYQTTATIDTDATNFKFTLSTSCTNLVVVYAVEFAGVPLGKTFRHAVQYEFGASSATPDTTNGWYEWAGILYIDVIAPTATNADALTVFYTRTPTDMTAVGSTFDFPDEWESAIVAYTLARCYNAQRDSVLEAKQMVKYETMRQSAQAINKWKIMGDAN